MKCNHFIVLVVLAFVAFGSNVWAKDRITDRPPLDMKRFKTEVVTAAEEVIIYTQTIRNAPGMWESRFYNQDFGWTHSFDAPYSYIQWSDLSIWASDVDDTFLDGEIDLIYADAQLLGALHGYAGTWSTTTFPVPVSCLSDEKVEVWVDIDSTYNTFQWALEIGSSTLRVGYVPIPTPDRDKAFRKMDEKWNTLSDGERAAKVQTADTLNKFTARYATLTGKQTERAIEKVKGTNPAYAGIDTKLVKSLVFVESAYNFLALSNKGAVGLGQKLTGTIDAYAAFTNLQATLDLSSFKYQNLALDNRTLPEHSVDMALSYVAYLIGRPFINGDIDKMLAAYNGGEGRLWRILKNPRKRDQWLKYFPMETQDYVARVKKQAGIR